MDRPGGGIHQPQLVQLECAEHVDLFHPPPEAVSESKHSTEKLCDALCIFVPNEVAAVANKTFSIRNLLQCIARKLEFKFDANALWVHACI